MAWRLRQDTALEEALGQLVASWLSVSSSALMSDIVYSRCPENYAHRSTLQRTQRLRLCGGETGVPHRTGVLQYCPNHRDVEVQQVITPGAWSFQLLEEVQSRCRLRRDGVDMLLPLQVTRDVDASSLKVVTRSTGVPLRLTAGDASLIAKPISSSFVFVTIIKRPTEKEAIALADRQTQFQIEMEYCKCGEILSSAVSYKRKKQQP